MQGIPLLKKDYMPATKIYPVKKPDILSGSIYYFETDSGLIYQVSFGKKKDNYLGNIINFSVISDEYEDEYSETNRGEIYRVMTTTIEVIRIFHENHPYSNRYEFSGEFKKSGEHYEASIRTRMYHRVAMRVVDRSRWQIELNGNKVVLSKKTFNE